MSKAVVPMPRNQMLALPAFSPDIIMSGTKRVKSLVSLTPAPSSISPEKACSAEGTSNKFCSLFCEVTTISSNACAKAAIEVKTRTIEKTNLKRNLFIYPPNLKNFL